MAKPLGMSDNIGNDNKIKHLEFIQLVVTRMNVNSFLLKGWTITLVSALFAFAAKDSNPKYFWITFIAVPIFWGLDAYFLLQERLYRSLFDEIRSKAVSDIDFDMNAKKFLKGRNRWWPCIWSKTLFWFYFFLVVVIILVTSLIK